MLSATLAYSAILQHLVYTHGRCHSEPLQCLKGNDHVPPTSLNVFLQLPSYIIVAGQQHACSIAPPEARGVVMAMIAASGAAGSLLGIAVSPITKDPHMVLVYSLQSGLCLFAGLAIIPLS